jgi:hypothetical protein
MMIGAILSVVSFRDDRHYFLNIDLAFFRAFSYFQPYSYLSPRTRVRLPFITIPIPIRYQIPVAMYLVGPASLSLPVSLASDNTFYIIP